MEVDSCKVFYESIIAVRVSLAYAKDIPSEHVIIHEVLPMVIGIRG
jgi:hypothetical protein